MAYQFYPRQKHCRKWLLITEKEVKPSIVEKLQLLVFEEGNNIYTFDSNDTTLLEVYNRVASIFEDNCFDCAFKLLKPEKGEFVY